MVKGQARVSYKGSFFDINCFQKLGVFTGNAEEWVFFYKIKIFLELTVMKL